MVKPHSGRKLLQQEDHPFGSIYTPDLTLQPMINGSSTKRGLIPNSPFDSSMALTALILLTVLFFMGFFSIYLRRFVDQGASAASRRRNQHPPYSFSTRPAWRSANFRKGLDPSAVRLLPLVSYRGKAKHPSFDCVICLSEFEEGETVKLIPSCRHVFHPECIDTWLSSHVSCPLCRSSLLFALEDGSQVEVDRVVSAIEVRSAALSGETRADQEAAMDVRAVGPLGMRRTGSCPILSDRVLVVRRSSLEAIQTHNLTRCKSSSELS